MADSTHTMSPQVANPLMLQIILAGQAMHCHPTQGEDKVKQINSAIRKGQVQQIAGQVKHYHTTRKVMHINSAIRKLTSPLYPMR